MVISTRAIFAVISYPVIKPPYLRIPSISSRARLLRQQEEMNEHHNESSRQSHVRTKGTRLQQSDPLSALIRLIMVISTRADIAVTLFNILKSYYLNSPHISGKPRLPRLQEETKTYPNESSRQRHIKNIEANSQQKDRIIALIRAIMEISTRDGISVNYTNKRACTFIDLHRDRANPETLKRGRRESSHIATESRP